MELSRQRWRSDRGKVLKDSKGVIIDPSLKRGPGGFVLCRFCGKETSNEYTTFCGDSCIHKFKQQTQPLYLRQSLFDRDKGVCSFCERDCQSIYLKACSITKFEERFSFINSLNDSLFLKKTSACLRNSTVSFKPGMFWEAAHIIDVQDGGGSSDLNNFRTLCVPCHHRETKAKSFFKKILKEKGVIECPAGTTNIENTWSRPKFSEQTKTPLISKSNTKAAQLEAPFIDLVLENPSFPSVPETNQLCFHFKKQTSKNPTSSSFVDTTQPKSFSKEQYTGSSNSQIFPQVNKVTNKILGNCHPISTANFSIPEAEKRNVSHLKDRSSKRRVKFSQLEIDTLLIGIDKYGKQWAKIKQEYSTIFCLRSSIDLKDKARNLQRKIGRQDLGTQELRAVIAGLEAQTIADYISSLDGKKEPLYELPDKFRIQIIEFVKNLLY